MLCLAILSCAIALGPPPGAPAAPAAQGAHGAQDAQGAQGAQDAQGAQGAPGAWRVDVGVAALGEAWDVNESTDSLAGLVVGADRRAWRGWSIRGELLILRVLQQPDAAWLGGLTVGTRMRWGQANVRPVADVAVGLSSATRPVPQRGTTFNYLAVIGAGAEVPLRSLILTVTGRWIHASNNGREGRHRNPDIQALGVVVGVGWEY